MELIATARFKKALDRATEAEAYTRKIAELAADLSAAATNVSHPLLQKREQVKRVLMLVIGSNRGLCGGYNAGILREASGRLRQLKAEGVPVQLELSGKRPIGYFRYQGVAADKTFTHFEDKPRFDEVEELANRYLADFIAGRVDRVEVVYMKFLNAARQTPIVDTLLPLSKAAPETRPTGSGRGGEEEAAGGVRVSAGAEGDPGAAAARVVQGAAVQVLPGRGGQRADCPPCDDEGGDGERRQHDQELDPAVQPGRQAQITKEIAEVIGGAAALE